MRSKPIDLLLIPSHLISTHLISFSSWRHPELIRIGQFRHRKISSSWCLRLTGRSRRFDNDNTWLRPMWYVKWASKTGDSSRSSDSIFALLWLTVLYGFRRKSSIHLLLFRLNLALQSSRLEASDGTNWINQVAKTPRLFSFFQCLWQKTLLFLLLF